MHRLRVCHLTKSVVWLKRWKTAKSPEFEKRCTGTTFINVISWYCYSRVVLKYWQLVTSREGLLRTSLATKLPRPGDMVHRFNVIVKCCEHIKQHVCYSLLDAGESLLPVNHRQRVDTDGMLSVSAINRLSDAGWYTCDARDSTGQGMSRSVYVSVMGSSSQVKSFL